MSWSFTLVTVRGVRVRIHATFLLIFLWAAYNWGFRSRWGASGVVFGIVLMLLLFLCVVLHELAHSFVASAQLGWILPRLSKVIMLRAWPDIYTSKTKNVRNWNN